MNVRNSGTLIYIKKTWVYDKSFEEPTWASIKTPFLKFFWEKFFNVS